MDGVMCYLDDILIFASDSKTHDRILRLVLRKQKEAKVTLNKAKCVFGVQIINFLGHILDEDGIRPDPAKIEAVAKMPAPTDVHGVRRFLGMVNHLGRFVENLSEIVAPLNQLLVKGQDFVWDCSQERAFRKLKELLTTQHILAAYDVRKPTMVSSDASSYGLGAVLKQEGKNGIWRPVVYSSRTMTPTEKRYAQIEKEALAITWACERFHDFLLGKRFRIETDHKPLIPLFSTKELSSLTPRLQHFRMRMMRFGFEIAHIPGKELLDADALSRQPLLTTEGGEDERPTSAHINAVLSSIIDKDEMLTKIFEAQQEDTTLKAVVNYLEQGWPDKKKMSQALLSYWHFKDELGVQNGLLMRSCRLVIPASMKLEILDKLHAGHFGITKTRLRARETVWWLGISEEIAETVRKCSVCIQEAVSKHEPLIPTNFPTRPWQKIGMDLFKFENKWYLVVIDYYSRYSEMIQLDRLTANEVTLKRKEGRRRKDMKSRYDRRCGATDMEELSEDCSADEIYFNAQNEIDSSIGGEEVFYDAESYLAEVHPQKMCKTSTRYNGEQNPMCIINMRDIFECQYAKNVLEGRIIGRYPVTADGKILNMRAKESSILKLSLRAKESSILKLSLRAKESSILKLSLRAKESSEGVKYSEAEPKGEGVKYSEAEHKGEGVKYSEAEPKGEGVKYSEAESKGDGVKYSEAESKGDGVKDSETAHKAGEKVSIIETNILLKILERCGIEYKVEETLSTKKRTRESPSDSTPRSHKTPRMEVVSQHNENDVSMNEVTEVPQETSAATPPQVNEEDIDEDGPWTKVTHAKRPRIPPVIAENVTDWKLLCQELKDLCTDKFQCTISGNKHIIKAKNISDFKKIREYVQKNNGGYSYRLQEEKPLKVVLKGVTTAYKTENIAIELATMGFTETSVKRLHRQSTKRPMNLVLVELPKNEHNKKIYGITELLYQKIAVESFRTTNRVTQCFNCQGFGHGQLNCFLKPKCVKCAEEHHSKDCPKKSRQLPPKLPLKTEVDIDSAVGILNEKINNSYSKNTIVSSSKLIKNPKTKALIREKNKARKRWQSTWDPAHRATYLNLQGKVNQALEAEKSENWNSFLSKLESSPTDFWKKTKPIRKKADKITSLNANGKTLLTDKEIGNDLSEHFSKHFSKAEDEVPSYLTDNTCHHPQENILSMTTPNEVKEVIKNLGNHKAPGHDNITPQMTKNLPIKWIVFLAGIFNAALHLCYFPKTWKHAIIITIPKKSPVKSPEVLRPISLLSTIEKGTPQPTS
ncbi:K02A2.6-like [Cordylochernes scorpioides]|uniref:RNA-directed DNA polymerase n=1 Tax=Cordylochernes scorpioides TaxID=51811 RepID=A0ABY6KCC4_9ARAC|nr:K02A2.6-like [Cordylochernes scorpioides]